MELGPSFVTDLFSGQAYLPGKAKIDILAALKELRGR
jgi:hypothetical protein